MDPNNQLGLAGPLNIKSEPVDTSESAMDYTECDQMKARLEENSHRHPSNPQRLKNLSYNIQICERCVKTFDSRELLLEHNRQSHQDDPPMKNCICKACSKDLKTVTLLRIHMLVVHFGIMPFICQHCSAGFASRHWLLKHMKKDHSEVALFKCPSCNKFFITESGMMKHNDKAHVQLKIEYDPQTGKTIYPCGKCETKFESKDLLSKHLMKAHPSFMLMYKCPLCLQLVRYRRQHMRVQHDVEYDAKEHHYLVRYKCHCCLKLFQQRRKLLIHQNSLTKQCGRCQMRFKTNKSLQAHMATHRGKKSFECEDCGLDYRFRARLEEHRMRYHSPTSTQKLKILNCPYCPQLFTSLSNRARHIALYHEQSELKVNCAHCPVQVTDTVLLRKHYKKVHPEEVVTFKCPECEKCYLARSSFKDHYKKHKKGAGAVEDVVKESGQTNDQNEEGLISIVIKEEAFVQIENAAAPGGVMIEIKQEPLDVEEAAISAHLTEGEESTAGDGIGEYEWVVMEEQEVDFVAMNEFRESNIDPMAAENWNVRTSVEQQVVSTESATEEKPVLLAIEELQQEEKMEVDETIVKLVAKKPARRSNKMDKCEDCGLFFGFRGRLEEHRMRYHSPTSTQVLKILNCPYCPKLFTSASNRGRHISVNHVQSEFKVNCAHCPVQVRDTVLLRKHYKMVHPEERVTFKCPECEKSYLARSSFRDHYAGHKKEVRIDKNADTKSTSVLYRKSVPVDSSQLTMDLSESSALNMAVGSMPTDLSTEHDPCGDDELEDNIFLRLKNRTYQCKFCPEIFRRLREIRKHNKKQHPPEQKSFRCMQCTRRFPSALKRDRHVHFHSLNHPFKCTECDQMYRSKKRLEKHFQTFHDRNSHNFSTERFHCESCELTFVERQYYDLHSRIYHDRKPQRLKILSDKYQVCERCVLKFDSRDLLLEHIRQTHQGDPPMKNCICKTCSKDLKTMTLLRIHILVVHFEIMPFVCQHCNAGYATRYLLLQHMDTDHSAEASFSCPSCNESFTTESRMMKHKAKVHKKRVRKVKVPIQLKIEHDRQTEKTVDARGTCENKLESKDLSNKHLVKAHPSFTLMYKCPLCSRSVRDWKEHMHVHGVEYDPKEHHYEVRYKCHCCPKLFQQKRQLVVHQNALCKKCGRCQIRFNTYKSWQAHMTSHRKKSFKCEDCGLYFECRGRLEDHWKRYHSPTSTQELKIINCPYCPKLFTSPSNRARHIAVHHVQNEFKMNCAHCSVQVTDSVQLRKHYRKLHPERRVRFKCPECGKCYLSWNSFKDHYKKHSTEAEADEKAETDTISDSVEDGAMENGQYADAELDSIVIKEEVIIDSGNGEVFGVSAATGIEDDSLNTNEPSELGIKIEVKQEPMDDGLF